MKQYIEQFMNQYNITADVGIILIVIGIVMIVVFFIGTVIDVWRIKKREAKYLDNFTKEYYATHNIKQTLKNIRASYKDRQKEAKAIDAGLYYLDHSLLRDYKGALSYMEILFNSKKIKEFHEQCIKDAQSQKCLLLEKLEGFNEEYNGDDKQISE